MEECDNMSDYNAAIEDAAKVACPGDARCDCVHKDDQSGFWMTDCHCRNSGDLVDAASWCAAANMADAIRRLKR
jgi:hypothetical protein